MRGISILLGLFFCGALLFMGVSFAADSKFSITITDGTSPPVDPPLGYNTGGSNNNEGGGGGGGSSSGSNNTGSGEQGPDEDGVNIGNPGEEEDPDSITTTEEDGETTEETIVVENTTDEEITVIIEIDPESEVPSEEEGLEGESELIVEVPETEITLQPGESIEVPISITAPEESTQPSSTQIAIQAINPETGESIEGLEDEISIFNAAPGTAKEKVDFIGAEVSLEQDEEGNPYIQFTAEVHNSGNLPSKLSYQYAIENAPDSSGLVTLASQAQTVFIAPGKSKLLSFRLAASGADSEGAKFDFQITQYKLDGETEIIYRNSGEFSPIPEFIRFMEIFFIGFFILLFFLLKKRIFWIPYTVESTDTFEKIALKHDVPRRKLAKRNKFEFEVGKKTKLKKGEKIFVPRFGPKYEVSKMPPI